MSRPAEAGAVRRRIERFTRAERYVHRATATLMLVLIATGAVLYLPSLSVRIGHRPVVALIHLYCGFALPIPMAAGLFSRAYRADARRLNRHSETDREWLRNRAWRRERARELALPVGKFNAGQKLNAAFQCGAILVMAGTGTLMWFPHLVGVSARTGATFVHDWLALAIGFVVIGHVWFALNDHQARIGMRTGYVTRGWAQREHPAWAAEVAAQDRSGDGDPDPDAVSEAEDRAARGEAGARDREEGRAVHQARAWDR
ncbi:cytochrome b/b6 domain-containing protein [Catenulispora pinisilvae]|uniref:cytochrome b/b6 domain-containing protein n=1 Tax=Catenulispora pinisilvae TaxID=2705253 RepID=UPI00189270D5|nr:cytochrome b/b6 domain-containing protein [Catenulispora pinisilvae]